MLSRLWTITPYACLVFVPFALYVGATHKLQQPMCPAPKIALRADALPLHDGIYAVQLRSRQAAR